MTDQSAASKLASPVMRVGDVPPQAGDAIAASTPWGESFADLADAVLADKSAPPVLLLAAFLYKRGAEARLRSLIAEAVALNG